MQSLTWYMQRLRAMSADEVAWRVRSAVRDATDRYRYPGRRRAAAARAAQSSNGPLPQPGLSVTASADSAAARPGEEPVQSWNADLLARAERIAVHRIDLFDQEDCFLGDPIDWNRDHKAGIAAPLLFAPSIDYRDHARSGDCKFVWEPSRHQHLVVLARAYRTYGEIRFAHAAAGQLESWLAACPFGLGMNWRSPLELAIRLINWVWTLDLLRPSGVIRGTLAAALAESVNLHLWEVARKYSRGSSANNHLVGEAAGVFIAASYFTTANRAAQLRRQSREILLREIEHQNFADGGNREQAFGYHFFVLEMFLLSGMVARASGQDFPERFWQGVRRMAEFAVALCEAGPMPNFGDADDGYLLDLESRTRDPRWLLGACSRVLPASLEGVDPRWGAQAAQWLPIPAAPTPEPVSPPRRLTSRAFEKSGYYLLQSGAAGSLDSISVLFDCGQLGFGAIAAHGHADALSFSLRAFGQDFLVDPGTYDYFTYAEWRQYFRSTRAHNTIEVDGQDQSSMLGKFLWGSRANATCLEWQPNDFGGTVVGEHDGYQRLPDPVRHRRRITLDARARELEIQDEIFSSRAHELRWFAHVAEGCRVNRLSASSFELIAERGSVMIALDPRLEWRELRASANPIGGWVSRGYHRKSPSTTICGCIAAHGNLSLLNKIVMGPVDANGNSCRL